MNNVIKFLCLNVLLIGSASLAMDPGYAYPGIQTQQATPGADVNLTHQASELRSAARLNNVAQVQELLDAGAPVDAKDHSGQTPLLEAAIWGHNEVCELLMARNAQADTKDNAGWTPLKWAALNRHNETCKLLVDGMIKQKLDSITAEYIKQFANSLRALPASKAEEMMTGYLNKHVKQLEQELIEKINAINNATLKESLQKQVKEQLEVQSKRRIGLALVKLEPTTKTLCEAAKLAELEQVETLLNQGVSANSRAWRRSHPQSWQLGEWNHTPLHSAVLSGEPRCRVKQMMMPATIAESPDHTARRRREVCKLLLNRNALIDAKDEAGKTPLAWAAQNGLNDLCTLLIEHKSDIDTTSNGGNTPLYWAAFNHEMYDVCQLLLNRNARINVKNSQNDTPLMAAARAKNIRACHLLIDTTLDRSILPGAIVAFMGIKKFRRGTCIDPIDRNIIRSIAELAYTNLPSLERQGLFAQIDEIEEITDNSLKDNLLIYALQKLNMN